MPMAYSLSCIEFSTRQNTLPPELHALPADNTLSVSFAETTPLSTQRRVIGMAANDESSRNCNVNQSWRDIAIQDSTLNDQHATRIIPAPIKHCHRQSSADYRAGLLATAGMAEIHKLNLNI